MKLIHPVFKKKLPPLFGYAFLLSAGTIAITSSSALMGPEQTPINITAPAPIEAAVKTAGEPRESWPQDLASLKKSTIEFDTQLSTIKSMVATLEKAGRIPPQKLYDSIGKADQLIALINQAQTIEDIGFNAADRLESIAAEIAANSKF